MPLLAAARRRPARIVERARRYQSGRERSPRWQSLSPSNVPGGTELQCQEITTKIFRDGKLPEGRWLGAPGVS